MSSSLRWPWTDPPHHFLIYPCSTNHLLRCAARWAILKPSSDLISHSQILSGSAFILQKLHSPWPAMQSHVQYCLVNLCSQWLCLLQYSLGSSPTKPLGASFSLVCTCHSDHTLHVHSTLIHSGPDELSPWRSAFSDSPSPRGNFLLWILIEFLCL